MCNVFFSDVSVKKRRLRFGIWTCVVTALIMCLSGCSSSGASNIVGTWEKSNGATMSFNSSGSFEGRTKSGYTEIYGTYTFYDDKLSMTYKQDGPIGTYTESYEWNQLAKEDRKYWYISGNKLYLYGSEYTSK